MAERIGMQVLITKQRNTTDKSKSKQAIDIRGKGISQPIGDEKMRRDKIDKEAQLSLDCCRMYRELMPIGCTTFDDIRGF